MFLKDSIKMLNEDIFFNSGRAHQESDKNLNIIHTYNYKLLREDDNYISSICKYFHIMHPK